jgi:glycosyltransferase involved in cell wall biosynthesis
LVCARATFGSNGQHTLWRFVVTFARTIRRATQNAVTPGRALRTAKDDPMSREAHAYGAETCRPAPRPPIDPVGLDARYHALAAHLLTLRVISVSDSSHDPVFTILTATYNRADTLPRVRDCLDRQTFRDFEWLIVDDGSTDGTRQLVEGWRSTTDLPLRYIYQPHAGQHVAMNRGIREAHGQFFLQFDSDDGAVPEALERFKFHWESIPADERPRYSAVTALRIYDDGRPVGDRFPHDITGSDSLEMYFKYRVRGDKWGFQRTDVLRDHLFPEPPGIRFASESFVSESVVWFAIARRFKTRYVNDYLGINYRSGPAEPRLSKLTVATANGRLVFHKAVIEDYLDCAIGSPVMLLKSLINYSRYSFLSGIGPWGQVGRVRTGGRKVLVLSVVPFGYAFYLRDRLRWSSVSPKNGGD